MSKSLNVEQYFIHTIDFVKKIKIKEKDIFNKMIEKILCTSPIKYDHVIATIIKF